MTRSPGEQQGKKLHGKVSMSSNRKTNQEFIPMVLLMSATIQKVHFSGQPLLCLLDSGTTIAPGSQENDYPKACSTRLCK